MSNIKKFLLTVMIGIVALILEFGFHQNRLAFWLVAIVGGIMTVTMLIGMIETLRSGKYGVDILAITAIVATLLVGEYWASLMVLIMLTGGDSLEDYASHQASRELRSLLDNSPQTAHRIKGEEITDLAVEEVEVGDLILVKPGELVPVDGRVVEGESFVDESSLTGESKPIEKKQNDELMSGSINGDAALRFKVTKAAKDSQYQTLVKLVKESEAKPAHFVRLADRYAVPFTIIAYVIGGVAWFVSKDPVRFAEVLVVASPCPLILAAPVALVAGMSRSSRNGIVVKTGTTIEKLANAKSIAFDKTGTLTEGKLSVEDIKVDSDHFSKEELITYAASGEQESSHILARSLVAFAKEKKIDLFPVTELEEITGQGIQAKVNGKNIRVGKASFAGSPIELTNEHTAVYVSVDNQYIGYITFTDIVRKESADTIKALNDLGIKKTIMLTGDHQSIANQIAHEVGISEVHAECLPEEKIKVLKMLNDGDRPGIMVGDGVNDAPALAVADVGIAMGAHGSTAASESADAVILKDDLSRVSEAVRLSQDTMRIARQSVLIGLVICIILMLIASTGVIPALLGAALQEVIDTVSILSALRARKDR
ncbi:heavy metal translocating P-type ATPase [Enterococcus hulanensis]|uniref:Cd(2+)-exporting ATPase n=1 Tax=Enterococcus hulanensis TaxID=2559929 RepID=A0ABU3ETT0_9ENTE|nr:heavy metal translocating P-type ATPase [Enterococcus hulanensis]MDT2598275.1 heavy metal translocating P-type ATPase [Enterococcus hulanensis]MDT2608220.1 heavy metal translocating P-type ATPase [Enterococcus hulanensis]MDT2615515.1 heavy metal translocating P-type ATPase [Enterococcus hulanensis]MDT2626514.1 heavy metal translocating P-type ATPase [Enterococcus hulanensis]MDT2654587.1 heavy metal translocating P-type ATPase [Enterococcus hulanensis]